MTQRTLGIASAVVLLVVVVAALWYVRFVHPQQLQNASTAPANASLARGDAAPAFSLPTTDGGFDLSAQTRPVFLEVFATWCPHCQRETVVLNALYKIYASRVAFVAIPGSDTGMDGTSPETQADVLNFQSTFHVVYPIALYDPALAVAKAYLQGGYPTIAVIDRNKKIAYINSGEVSQKDLAAAIESALR